MPHPTKSNASDGRRHSAEASAEAALTLVESLIHGLVAHSRLSLDEAIEVVQVAVDTQIDVSDERGESDGKRPAVDLLTSIAASLRIDMPETGLHLGGAEE